MFKCNACLAKNKHIEDLNKRLDKQSELLEKIVAPTYQYAQVKQANIALDGAGHEQEPENSDSDQKLLSPVERQALAMLTGSY